MLRTGACYALVGDHEIEGTVILHVVRRAYSSISPLRVRETVLAGDLTRRLECPRLTREETGPDELPPDGLLLRLAPGALAHW